MMPVISLRHDVLVHRQRWFGRSRSGSRSRSVLGEERRRRRRRGGCSRG
jgi:hypothetical protein